MNPSAVKILDRYRRLCSAREYCTSDVLDKVRKALRASSTSTSASPSRVSGRSRASTPSEVAVPSGRSHVSASPSEVAGPSRASTSSEVAVPSGRSHVSASPSEVGSSRSSYSSGAAVPAAEPVESVEQMAQEIVASLIEDRYIDDRRYAEAFARDKASISGWGPVKIRFMLRGKGIPDDIINDALSEVDASRADRRLEKLLQNKYQQLRDDPQCRLKLIRFALGRGYQYADISSLIDATIKGTLDA